MSGVEKQPSVQWLPTSARQNGAQAALMAPTQILASQHMDYFSTLSVKAGFRPVLLTSGLKKSDRNQVYEDIANGQYNLIIGTQSLISKESDLLSIGPRHH